MSPTKIEWAQESWNPITGCTPISEGCKNCYARRMSKRLRGRCGYPADDPFRVTLHPDRMEQPLHWRKSRRIFVCSMADLFHEDVPAHFIYKVFEVMRNCPHHVFILCTKRAKRMKKITDDVYFHLQRNYHNSRRSIFPLPNVIKMVTAENQAMADLRIFWLSQTQAAIRGVSLEPMLGSVDLSNYLYRYFCVSCGWQGNNPHVEHIQYSAKRVPLYRCPACDTLIEGDGKTIEHPTLNWVICGGESGPGVRPAHPDWFRKVRDDCVAAGVPFFFKSWGKWVSPEQLTDKQIIKVGNNNCAWGTLDIDGNYFHLTTPWNGKTGEYSDTKECIIYGVGKNAAGRELDGKCWDQMPGRM